MYKEITLFFYINAPLNIKCWFYHLLLSGWKILEAVTLPAHSWRSTGIRFVNVFPAYVNIRDCVYACACAHNYRCAIPPKLSLEKGMGMTPGYNHRLRLRNVLFSDPVLSRRQLKTPRSCAAYCLGKRCSLQPETSLLFFQVVFFFLLLCHFWRKKNRLCVFMSLSVCFALFGGARICCCSLSVRVRAQWAWLRLSSRDAGGPQTKEKMIFRALQESKRGAAGLDV